MGKSNPHFVNGVPELVILRLLSTREMYGYDIVRSIQTKSDGAFAFGEGCVYPILHSLLQGGFVKVQRKEVAGRTRNYYQLTARGRKRLGSLTTSWEQIGAGVAAILQEKHA